LTHAFSGSSNTYVSLSFIIKSSSVSSKSQFTLDIVSSQSFSVEKPLLVDSEKLLSGEGFMKVDVVIKLFELGEVHFPPIQLTVHGSYVKVFIAF
jgi:hypothetical protein